MTCAASFVTDHFQPHLLVVDDTPTHIEILPDALEPDYDVSFCTLNLLDVMTPAMEGYEGMPAPEKQRVGPAQPHTAGAASAHR
jgi:hypothetical protein